MKNLCFSLLTTFILVFIMPTAFGQTKLIEYAFEPGNEASTTHAAAVTNGWMVPANTGECQNERIAYINKNNGNIRYIQVHETGSPIYIINDIIQTAPNEFVCAGFTGKGSDVANLMHAMLYKMDSAGNVIWSVTCGGPSALSGQFRRVDMANDGSFYALASSGSDGYIARIKSNGSVSWQKPFDNVYDIAWTNAGLMLADSAYAILLDTAGSIIKDTKLNGPVFTRLQNGPQKSIYASHYGKVYHLDSDLVITDSADLHFTNNNSHIMVLAGDSAYYFTNSINLAAADFSGNLIWNADIPASVQVSGLAYDGSQIAVTGTNRAPFIKTFDKKGNTAPIIRNIAVTNVAAKDIKLHPSFDIPGNLNEKDAEMDLEVTVTNRGEETIDSFYLQSVGSSRYAGFDYDCSENAIQGYNNVNLAPGASIVVPFSLMRLYLQDTNNFYHLTALVTSVAPNGKLDGDTSNDSYLFIQKVAGINEPQLAPGSVDIYPNPASDILLIDNKTNTDTPMNITLSNITGQEIEAIHNPGAHTEINISSLPAGLYLVKVQSAIGIITQKVVKD